MVKGHTEVNLHLKRPISTKIGKKTLLPKRIHQSHIGGHTESIRGQFGLPYDHRMLSQKRLTHYWGQKSHRVIQDQSEVNC